MANRYYAAASTAQYENSTVGSTKQLLSNLRAPILAGITGGIYNMMTEEDTQYENAYAYSTYGALLGTTYFLADYARKMWWPQTGKPSLTNVQGTALQAALATGANVAAQQFLNGDARYAHNATCAVVGTVGSAVLEPYTRQYLY
jgi:hypothetical protein